MGFSPRTAELPQKLHYKGQPINVHISGPIHFLTVQKSAENRVSPELERYVDTLCDFSQVFSDLNKILCAKSEMSKQEETKSKGQQPLGFYFEVGSVRHVPTPKPASAKIFQRPSSIPPYLVQTSSYCHSAKVTEITQEWRLEREPDYGEVVGQVLCPPPTNVWGMERNSRRGEDRSRLPPTPPRSQRRNYLAPQFEAKPTRKSPIWGESPYAEKRPILNESLRSDSEKFHGLNRPGRFPTDNTFTLPNRGSSKEFHGGDSHRRSTVLLHKTRSEDIYRHQLLNDDQYANLKQTIRQVELDLDSAQRYTKESRSSQARQIEHAICTIGERISKEAAEKWQISNSKNGKVMWTRAQAEANEELLRTRLAEMILNLDDDNDETPSTKDNSSREGNNSKAEDYNFSQLQVKIL